MKAQLLLHLLFQGVLLFDTLAWEVKMPKEIHGLQGSCLVIPCSFSYTSYPPKDPHRVVWFQWVSKGYPLVYDPWYPYDVIEKFRWKTDLYRTSSWDCSLLIKNLEHSHHGEKIYAWIDPENVGWRTFAFYDVTSTILVDASPDKPVMSSLPEDIDPGTRVTVKCSVNHTCPSHPPKISWSVPTARETISHNHMGGGVWERVSDVTFIPTGYEEKDEIVCSASFWGGKTQSHTAILSVKKIEVKENKWETFGLYAIAPSLVFLLICVLAGVCIYKRRHRQPCQDMQGLQTQSEHRRSVWNRFSSRFNMHDGRAAWTNRGNRGDIRHTGNAPERPPKPEQRRSIWSRFSRHQSPRNNANLRAEYKANNTCTVSGNKPFSKPHIPSPKSEPKSYRGYDL